MAQGGQREGKVGKAYGNRSDLAMASGSTSGHMAGGGAGMRGSGTSNTELKREARRPERSAASGAGSPAPQQAVAPGGAPPSPPGNLTPLDAPGGGGQMLDLGGREGIFPKDRDSVIRRLYRMTGNLDLLELLERRNR